VFIAPGTPAFAPEGITVALLLHNILDIPLAWNKSHIFKTITWIGARRKVAPGALTVTCTCTQHVVTSLLTPFNHGKTQLSGARRQGHSVGTPC
jgi:hypothetical protein